MDDSELLPQIMTTIFVLWTKLKDHIILILQWMLTCFPTIIYQFPPSLDILASSLYTLIIWSYILVPILKDLWVFLETYWSDTTLWCSQTLLGIWGRLKHRDMEHNVTYSHSSQLCCNVPNMLLTMCSKCDAPRSCLLGIGWTLNCREMQHKDNCPRSWQLKMQCT